MNRLLILLAFISYVVFVDAQDKTIDKVVAVIGEDIVLKSDIETQYIQYVNSQMAVDENTKCMILKDLVAQKLILNQAKLDSVEVSEGQVNQELERRLRYFISQLGSEKKLEEFYQKSIVEIKSEFHDIIEDQLLVQNMQQKLTGSVKVTPAEIRAYYNTIPKDSLPFINSEVEVAHILRKPPISEKEKEATKAKLQGFRDRVENGEDFGTIAYLYSEDPGSAKKNGELGFMPRNAFVPEFAAAGFSLKKGQVSKVIETQYGYHIIQMIEQRGEEANLRHILIKPKVSPYDLQDAKDYLDSIYNLMKSIDTLTFDIAAEKYSDDETTKYNGGLMINQQTGDSRFDIDQLSKVDATLFYVIDKLEVGEISEPLIKQMQDGSKAFRIIKVVKRTEPHIANMVDDYQKIQDAATNIKKAETMSNWFTKKVKKTYIRLDKEYRNCGVMSEWGLD